MKQSIFTFAFLLIIGFVTAQPKSSFTKSDAALIAGVWKGRLTYLDYTSGKPFTMPANITINSINGTNNLLEKSEYPNEPKANGVDTMYILQNGLQINGASVTARTVSSDGTVKIVTEKKGRDGNDNKEAIIRKTYFISSSRLTILKEVKFVDGSDWITRNEYSYTR